VTRRVEIAFTDLKILLLHSWHHRILLLHIQYSPSQ
jgi:hypothetical protein